MLEPIEKNLKYAVMLILLIGLAMLLTRCQTSPDPVVVYRTAPPPALEFPIVPDPEGFVDYDDDSGKILVDYEYWVQLAEYMIDVEATREKYEAMRNIYENNDGL